MPAHSRPQRQRPTLNYAEAVEDNEGDEEYQHAGEEEEEEYQLGIEEEEEDEQEDHFTPSDAEDNLVGLPRPKSSHRGRKRRRDEEEDVEIEDDAGLSQATFLPLPQADHGSAATLNATLLPFSPIPSFDDDMEAYNHFAREILDSLRFHGETNLPPILSLLYIPWWVPDYTEHLRDEQGEKIIPQRSNQPLLDIPWLPIAIPYETPDWKLVIFDMLGATPGELGNRVPADDEIFSKGARKTKDKQSQSSGKTRKHVSKAFRMRIMRWSASKGGLRQLSQHQETHKGKPPAAFQTILLGELYNDVKCRDGLTSLQLYLNCVWHVDPASRSMQQPDGRRVYPLFQPHYPQRFHDFLRRFNENNAREHERAVTIAIQEAAKKGKEIGTSTNRLPQVETPDPARILSEYPTLVAASQNGVIHAAAQDPSQHAHTIRPTKKRATGKVPADSGPPEDGLATDKALGKRPHGDPNCNGQCPVCCPQSPEFTDQDLFEVAARDFKPENHHHDSRNPSIAAAQPPLNPLGGSDDTFWEKRWAWDAENDEEWNQIETEDGRGNQWPLNQNVAPRPTANAFYLRRLEAEDETAADDYADAASADIDPELE